MMMVLPVRVGMRVMAVLVVMVMAVIMMVRVLVVVIMGGMRVRVAMRMAVAMAGIGTAHWIEGGNDLFHLGIQPVQHGLDDVVAQNQDTIRRDGRCEMAIADMPGELGEMERIAAPDGVERLLGRRDLDDAAALDRQRIAGCQHDRLREVDQDLPAVIRLDHAPAQVTFIMLENGAAEDRLGRLEGVRRSPDGYCFQHAALRFRQGRFRHPAVSPPDTLCQALTME